MIEEKVQNLKIKKQISLVKAEKKDINILKKVLTRSFIDDPFTNWMIKQDEKKLIKMEIMFETMLKNFGLRYGEMYTTEDKSGCSIWIPPGKYNSNSFVNLLLLPAWIKVVGLNRISKIMKGTSAVEKYHPGSEYFYLMSLGTLPEMQGQGIGSALITPVLEKCDQDKIPACLETSNGKNLTFYEKHGFQIKNELIIPNGGPTTWIMTRNPL